MVWRVFLRVTGNPRRKRAGQGQRPHTCRLRKETRACAIAPRYRHASQLVFQLGVASLHSRAHRKPFCNVSHRRTSMIARIVKVCSSALAAVFLTVSGPAVATAGNNGVIKFKSVYHIEE